MSINKFVYYDIFNIFKSWKFYLSILFFIMITTFSVFAFYNIDQSIEQEFILSINGGIFSILMMLILSRIVSKDINYDTLQLFFNSKHNRFKYYISKFLTIFLIGLMSAIFVLLISYIHFNLFDNLITTNNIIAPFFIIYLSLAITYGLLLYFIAIGIYSVSLTYGLSMFLILIVPILTSIISLFPKYADNIINTFTYIPHLNLPYKVNEIHFSLTNIDLLSIFITILIFMILNLYISFKKAV